jgi:hypothetical protein
MIVWDTTPIMKCAAEVSAKADQIDAAVDWDELPTEKKDVMREARLFLLSRISWAKLQAEVVFQPVCPKSADFRDAVQS